MRRYEKSRSGKIGRSIQKKKIKRNLESADLFTWHSLYGTCIVYNNCFICSFTLYTAQQTPHFEQPTHVYCTAQYSATHLTQVPPRTGFPTSAALNAPLVPRSAPTPLCWTQSLLSNISLSKHRGRRRRAGRAGRRRRRRRRRFRRCRRPRRRRERPGHRSESVESVEVRTSRCGRRREGVEDIEDVEVRVSK